MIKELTDKQMGHALFMAIKHNDFQHAQYLLRQGAPVQTAFNLDQQRVVYTSKNYAKWDAVDYFVGKVAECVKKYGYNHPKSSLLLDLLDQFIENKADLRCHCSPKHNHYCALSEAFKFISFNSEQDYLTENNLLILKLLYHNATYKNHANAKNHTWYGIQSLLSYLQTRRDQATDLLRRNRHFRCSTAKFTAH